MKSSYYVFSRLLVLLTFSLLVTSLYSQEESVIYIGTNGKLCTVDHALTKLKTTVSNKSSMVNTLALKDTAWIEVASEQYKLLNDSTYRIKGTGENIPATTIRTFKKTSEGMWEFKDVVKDQVKKKGACQSVLPLVLNGEVTEYFPNGNKKSVSQYRNNELLSNRNWLENGDKYIDNIFYSVDSDPTFNSGMKVLHQHIIDGFKNDGINISIINGMIRIGFIVMENGKIDGIRIIDGLGKSIDESVCNSFRSLQFKGSWTPARLNGQVIRYFQVFPINFKYDGNQTRYATVRHDIMELKNKE